MRLLLCLLLLVGMPARAAENDCPTPINGSLKGEAGNNQDTPFHSLAVDPSNPAVAYVGTEANGIFKTTDGGQNWTRLRNGLKCTIAHTFYSQMFDIAVDPTTPQTLYAAAINGPGPVSPVTNPSASGGVYKSTDGGVTWVQKNSGLASTYVTYVLVDATTPNRLYAVVGGLRATYPVYPGPFVNGGIYVSTDGAESWSPLTLPSGLETNIFIDAVLRGADQRRIFASGQVHSGEAPTAYGLLRSSDGGATWSLSNPAGETVQGFDVSKSDPDVVYANVASGRRAHRSTDGGTTWTATGPTIFFGVLRVHPSDSQTVYFTGSAGSIWKSSDGLASVQQVYADAALAPDQYVTDIEIAPSNGNVIWAAAKGYFVYRSSDGGATWTKFTGVRELVYGKTAVDFSNAPATSIAPVRFTGGAVTSYLRVHNPGSTAGTVQVQVRDELGTLLGTFTREVGAHTAPQFAMSQIEADAALVIPTRAGAFAQFEIRANFDGTAQHVAFDSTLGVLTNLSICRSAATGLSAATVSSTSAVNVHSSRIATIPGQIVLANGDSAPATAALDVYDAGTGDFIGRWTSPSIPASGARVVPIGQIESEMNFTPTTQYHLILSLVGTSRITLGHYADNVTTGVRSDMGPRCSFRAQP